MPFFCSSAKQRANEVIEWRAFSEQQEKMKEDTKVIEAKQKEHRDAYKKEREGLTNLTWKQRRAVLYKAKRHLMAIRPKENVQSDKSTLSVIIKGKTLLVACSSWCSRPSLEVSNLKPRHWM